MLLGIALMAEIAYAVLNISTMPVYLQYDRQFGASVIGLIIATFLLCEAIFKGPCGAIADRFGRKWLIVIGPFISVMTTIATLLIPKNAGYLETISFMILRAMDGIGAALLWPAAFALIGDMVEDSKRQHAMSLLNMCYLVGIALALPIGGAANDILGPQFANFTGARSPALFLAAVLFLGASLLAYFGIKSEPRHDHDDDTEEHVSIWAVLGSIKEIPGFLALAAVSFIGIGFPMAIVKLFSEQQLHLSESQFGLLALPAALAMAVSSVPMSKLGEKMGRAKAVHYGLGLCTIGMVLISLGGIFQFLRHPFIVAIGIIPVGIGFLLTIPAWMAAVADINPKRRAVNLGAIMTAQGLGAIIGMPIGSVLYEKLQPLGVDFGRYSPFMGCAICIGCGFLISLHVLKST